VGRKSRDEIQQGRIAFVQSWIDECKEATVVLRKQWQDAFEQFVEGSRFDEKEDWQSDFSTGKLETRIRRIAGKARAVLLGSPDWYSLKPINPDDQLATMLAPLLKRLMDYYLQRARFKRRAGTYVLAAWLGMASIVVGWRTRLVPNPKVFLRNTRKQEKEEELERADKVDNSEVTMDDLVGSPDDSLEDMLTLMFQAEAGDIPVGDEDKPFVKVGGLDLQVINPANRYWDISSPYIEESPGGAYDTEVRMWKLQEWAEAGYIKKSVIKDLSAASRDHEVAMKDAIYRGLSQVRETDLVKLTVYFGPLVEERDGRSIVTNPHWGCIIANDSKIIKEWETYPFWEPVDHPSTPFVDSAVKEIPYRPVGAGAGTNAVKCCKWLDSNLNLANDAMRFNTAGINVVDFTRLVDRGALESGIEPGAIIETTGDPDKVFSHVSLTSNIERQWAPVDQKISEAIDEVIGVDEMSMGGPVTRSRVTGAEVQARTSATADSANNVALDLELTFITPFLQKVLARVLQFGLRNVMYNPELKRIFSEEEISLLQEIGGDAEQRMDILHHFYSFEVKGFSSQQDMELRLNKLNELLSIANSGGPASQIVNIEVLVKEIAKALDVADIDKFVAMDTPLSVVIRENQLLTKDNRPVQVLPTDDHKYHLQGHEMLVYTAMATEALQQHIQEHYMHLQQQEMMAQQQEPVQQGV
jgi:hypothetical protein